MTRPPERPRRGLTVLGTLLAVVLIVVIAWMAQVEPREPAPIPPDATEDVDLSAWSADVDVP